MGQLAICQMKYLPSFFGLCFSAWPNKKKTKQRREKGFRWQKEIPICPQIWFTLSQKSMVSQGKG